MNNLYNALHSKLQLNNPNSTPVDGYYTLRTNSSDNSVVITKNSTSAKDIQVNNIKNIRTQTDVSNIVSNNRYLSTDINGTNVIFKDAASLVNAINSDSTLSNAMSATLNGGQVNITRDDNSGFSFTNFKSFNGAIIKDLTSILNNTITFDINGNNISVNTNSNKFVYASNLMNAINGNAALSTGGIDSILNPSDNTQVVLRTKSESNITIDNLKGNTGGNSAILKDFTNTLNETITFDINGNNISVNANSNKFVYASNLMNAINGNATLTGGGMNAILNPIDNTQVILRSTSESNITINNLQGNTGGTGFSVASNSGSSGGATLTTSSQSATIAVIPPSTGFTVASSSGSSGGATLNYSLQTATVSDDPTTDSTSMNIASGLGSTVSNTTLSEDTSHALDKSTITTSLLSPMLISLIGSTYNPAESLPIEEATNPGFNLTPASGDSEFLIHLTDNTGNGTTVSNTDASKKWGVVTGFSRLIIDANIDFQISSNTDGTISSGGGIFAQKAGAGISLKFETTAIKNEILIDKFVNSVGEVVNFTINAENSSENVSVSFAGEGTSDQKLNAKKLLTALESVKSNLTNIGLTYSLNSLGTGVILKKIFTSNLSISNIISDTGKAAADFTAPATDEFLISNFKNTSNENIDLILKGDTVAQSISLNFSGAGTDNQSLNASRLITALDNVKSSLTSIGLTYSLNSAGTGVVIKRTSNLDMTISNFSSNSGKATVDVYASNAINLNQLGRDNQKLIESNTYLHATLNDVSLKEATFKSFTPISQMDFTTSEGLIASQKILQGAEKMQLETLGKIGNYAQTVDIRSNVIEGADFSMKNSTSRIVDADMALEMLNNACNQIKSEASVAILSTNLSQQKALALQLFSKT